MKISPILVWSGTPAQWSVCSCRVKLFPSSTSLSTTPPSPQSGEMGGGKRGLEHPNIKRKQDGDFLSLSLSLRAGSPSLSCDVRG